MRKGKSEPKLINTESSCGYGCGNKALFLLSNGKQLCCKNTSSCPEVKRKNSDKLKLKHEEARLKNGKAGLYEYSLLPDETKKRMQVIEKGTSIEESATLANAHKTRAVNYDNGKWKMPVVGVAADRTKRWKRNLIPYIDSKGTWCILESYHELKVANELDKNNIDWVRPEPLELSDGRKYEPDFYIPCYDIYLDPKTRWQEKALKKYQGFHKQEEQLDKIKKCEEELGVKCLTLWSSNKDSHVWEGIKKQILLYKGLTIDSNDV